MSEARERDPAGGTADYSVVIPTRDGGARLLEVLDALAVQRGAPRFEVVVADDGSVDGTAERVATRPHDGLAVRISPGEPRGPAVARNRGVREARGRFVAFLGDDTLPEPDWLASHERARIADGGGEAIATLGYTTWHPRVRPTAFLRFLNEEGLQFGYSLIEDPADVPFNFFYTSNVTLARTRLLEEPFDERFPHAAWEDTEAALRLTRRGLRIVYAPEARALHDHPTDFDRFCERQERAGRSAVLFHRLHPELGGFLGLGPHGPPPLPPAAVCRARDALVRALQPLPVAARGLWSEALRIRYLRGLHRGWGERATIEGG